MGGIARVSRHTSYYSTRMHRNDRQRVSHKRVSCDASRLGRRGGVVRKENVAAPGAIRRKFHANELRARPLSREYSPRGTRRNNSNTGGVI